MRRIAIVTSGGDAPGMNAAVRAATRSALSRGWEVVGVNNGYVGLIANDMRPLSARDVGGIIQHGGTMLGSSRCTEFMEEAGREKALESLAKRSIDALVVIGGNGSQTGASKLNAMGFAVVGVASTIDNDLVGTDASIGADTAVNVTIEATDRLRTTASSHHRAFLVETMGRNCGYIALVAGIAGGAEVIAVPEFEIMPAEVARLLGAAYERGKTHALVVVAEGARYGARELMDYFAEHRKRTGFELRATTLGHVVRGGVPSAFDRLLASRLGAAAIDRLAVCEPGSEGELVGMRGGVIVVTPLSQVAEKTKPIDMTLLDLGRTLAK